MSPGVAMLALAAVGWLIAAAAMGGLWRWQLHLRRPRLAEAASPLITAVLAVAYANIDTGAGPSVRRAAIAWMVGSWGARLGVYLLWDDVFEQPPRSEVRESLAHFERHAAEALFFAIPALVVSFDQTTTLSPVALAAAAAWLVGFAGETTADRQLVRWRRSQAGESVAGTADGNPVDAPDAQCRAGVWRYVPRAHDVFELVTWVAHAAFVWRTPYGWLAIACPIAVAYRVATAGTRRAQL